GRHRLCRSGVRQRGRAGGDMLGRAVSVSRRHGDHSRHRDGPVAVDAGCPGGHGAPGGPGLGHTGGPRAGVRSAMTSRHCRRHALFTLVRNRARDDHGQLTVLVLGLPVIVLTVIIGALAVTSVQISRMRLLDAADAAALAATDEGAEQVYAEGLAGALP